MKVDLGHFVWTRVLCRGWQDSRALWSPWLQDRLFTCLGVQSIPPPNIVLCIVILQTKWVSLPGYQVIRLQYQVTRLQYQVTIPGYQVTRLQYQVTRLPSYQVIKLGYNTMLPGYITCSEQHNEITLYSCSSISKKGKQDVPLIEDLEMWEYERDMSGNMSGSHDQLVLY